MKYSFVIVVFRDEIGFSHLQARSIARYVARPLIEEIIIIENTPPTLPTIWRERLRGEFGHYRDLVKFVPAAAFAKIPPQTAGWFSQQVLKLMIAKQVQAKRYLMLDAKNHFVFPYNHIEANNKPRSFVHGYHSHPLRCYLQPILKYYGLSDKHLDRFLPTTTPFCVDTALVRDLITVAQTREARTFEELFLRSSVRFTEFFMIGAYILSTGRSFEEFYDLSGGGNNSVIWTHDATNEPAIAQAINQCEQQQRPMFTIHRRALPLLSERSRAILSQFWYRRALFTSEAAALKYLVDPNAGLF